MKMLRAWPGDERETARARAAGEKKNPAPVKARGWRKRTGRRDYFFASAIAAWAAARRATGTRYGEQLT